MAAIKTSGFFVLFLLIPTLLGYLEPTNAGFLRFSKTEPLDKTVRRHLFAVRHAGNWSNATLLLSRQGRIHTYHNYTTAQHDSHQALWTQRKSSTRPADIKGSKERRGTTVNKPRRMWTAYNTGRENNGRLWLFFCWSTKKSQRELGEDVKAAMDIWNRALGGCAGIVFYWEIQMCGIDYEIAPHASVTGIMTKEPGDWTDPKGEADATFGGPDPGKHGVMHLPLGSNSDGSGWSRVDTIVHELGHVLGLDHEHQRPDAPTYVYAYCKNIPGYEIMKQKVESGAVIWPHGSRWAGQRASQEQVCYYQELGLADDDLHYYPPLEWSGGAFLPEGRFPDNGLNAFNKPLMALPHGAFDFKSVMMYPTAPWGAIWKRGPPPEYKNERITGPDRPLKPTAGDIAAVKDMYPDIAPDVADLADQLAGVSMDSAGPS